MGCAPIVRLVDWALRLSVKLQVSNSLASAGCAWAGGHRGLTNGWVRVWVESSRAVNCRVTGGIPLTSGSIRSHSDGRAVGGGLLVGNGGDELGGTWRKLQREWVEEGDRGRQTADGKQRATSFYQAADRTSTITLATYVNGVADTQSPQPKCQTKKRCYLASGPIAVKPGKQRP